MIDDGIPSVGQTDALDWRSRYRLEPPVRRTRSSRRRGWLGVRAQTRCWKAVPTRRRVMSKVRQFAGEVLVQLFGDVAEPSVVLNSVARGVHGSVADSASAVRESAVRRGQQQRSNGARDCGGEVLVMNLSFLSLISGLGGHWLMRWSSTDQRYCTAYERHGLQGWDRSSSAAGVAGSPRCSAARRTPRSASGNASGSPRARIAMTCRGPRSDARQRSEDVERFDAVAPGPEHEIVRCRAPRRLPSKVARRLRGIASCTSRNDSGSGKSRVESAGRVVHAFTVFVGEAAGVRASRRRRDLLAQDGAQRHLGAVDATRHATSR